MKKVIHLSTIIFLIVLSSNNFAQDMSPGCKRTAYVGKCENLALPENYEQTQKEYNDCLEEELSSLEIEEIFITPETDIKTMKAWENALENCEHLKIDFGRKFAPVTREIMISSLQTEIASIITCDRFHIVNHAVVQAYRESLQSEGLPVKPDKSTIPEYFFEATYDCAKDPVIKTYEKQNGELVDEELWPAYLNLRMYFDGEQKELVKEWTVNGNNYWWSTLMRRMFRNRANSPGQVLAQMRKEVPITNLLDDFEKKPIVCQITPEKYKVEPGEEIEITISDFRDANQKTSREFNRILVKATEGKILNGTKCDAGEDYKVFRLDEQPIKVRFKAPKKSSTGVYQIIVYNSCDILPVEKSPLRFTKPDLQIASLELNKLSSEWNGKLTYQYTTQFECTHGSTINESENRNQFVELLLSMEKIDFKGSPVARINNVKGSGNITISYSSKKEETRKEYYGLKTIDANETFPVDQKNLIGVVLQKKMSEDPEAMRKRFEELSKSDPQKLMQEIKSMSNQKDEGEFPIEVVLNVSGNWPITAKIESISKSRFDYKNDSRTEKAPYLFKPMAIKLNGTMSLNADGTGTINAFYSAPEDLPNGKPASFGCPPIKGFVDCKLMLVKTKAN